jgi:hypothetical protein
MNTFFNILTRGFDVVLFPFQKMAPVWGVAFLSLLTAVFVLAVYKLASNQSAIARFKRRIQGHLLGIYLFRDDPMQVIGSLGRVFACSLRYVGYSLVPLVVVLAPIALICIQMQLRYGHTNPMPGDRLIVSLNASPGVALPVGGVRLVASSGLKVETPPMRIPGKGELDWRVGVVGAGDQYLQFVVGDVAIRKEIVVDNRVQRRYPVAARGSLLNSIVDPGGRTLPADSPVRSISVGYRSARINLFGIRMHWSIAYFLMAIVFGMLLKRFVGVEI